MLIGSAILLHVTNVFISLPALFINAKFPLCVKISGVVGIYFVLGAGYPYDVLLQWWLWSLTINQNILPKHQEPYSLSSYIFLSLMKIEVKCNSSLMMWSLLVIQLVIILASYTYMLIWEKTRLASRSLRGYRHISYQTIYCFAICWCAPSDDVFSFFVPSIPVFPHPFFVWWFISPVH